MARKIDRDQPEALAERPIELTREDARGRRIAVDVHIFSNYINMLAICSK